MKESAFTEADTEALFDDRERDQRFRSFWHPDGSLHWGYFENLADARPEDFAPACDRWDKYMLEQSGITAESRVLEIACGNGNAAIWLAQQTGCEVVGIDISSSYIDNARSKASNFPSLRVTFQKESATNLPFENGSFTHAWSQGALYHIHELNTALAEAHRVLGSGGIFLFDDLTTPVEEVSETSRKYVYDRLLFSPTFSLKEYAETLTQLGFRVLQQKDMSKHLEKSYELVHELAREEYADMSAAFKKTQEVIASNELGWCFFLCEKV
ncbi:MAG: class I SAM-dependent methyltransferase [Okeania sp. SIO3B5]|uniref:class I SAM-dependent methyltransferase n=1 Tax=Okeania sp. SIO3B5 TaxID=2607811 RepID=UPI001400DB98|nr:class I SAM-dependent methyltransferase [Okeania sp. SIO3B5]NEO53520.1 class I SAM-dependent methyltransferase [Okeania sp. SIO3B5]